MLNFPLPSKETVEPWLFENEPMNPRLMAMINDLKVIIDRHAKRRKYRHSREWI